MILLTLAAAALAQWTGPRTVEYVGPGNFCGGGYAVHLSRGERALVLPQGHGPQATRLVLSGGEVNILTGARMEPGRIVSKGRGSIVTEQGDANGIAYLVGDETPYGLRVVSSAFRGFKRDNWFFAKANFRSDADQTTNCLAGRSY
jgi:hypothetical protein